MNKSWFDWGICIAYNERHPLFPGISLKNPAGCALLLGDLMEADLLRITGLNEGHMDRIFRIKLLPTLSAGLNSQRVVLPGSPSDFDSGAVPPDACSFNIANLLGVEQKKTKTVYRCTPKPGNRCPKVHVSLADFTQDQVEYFANKFAMKQLKGPMVAKCKIYKKFAH
jgi:hypothetical protein